MRTSIRWSRGRRSALPLGMRRSAVMATSGEGTPRVRGAHATRTFVEPIAVGWGTSSPCSRNDWMCRGIASAMSFSTSSRERPAATQPGRSGTYAPQASPSCSITTTYSVTILPSRPAELPPDRSKRTLRHFITRLACHRHQSGPVGMAELAVRADLPVETPAVSLQSTDDVSNLHAPRVRERCDDLVLQSPARRGRCPRSSRRGKIDATNALEMGADVACRAPGRSRASPPTGGTAKSAAGTAKGLE